MEEAKERIPQDGPDIIKAETNEMHVVEGPDYLDEYDAEDPNITATLAWMGIHLKQRENVQAEKGLMIKSDGDCLAFTDGNVKLKVPKTKNGRALYAEEFYDILKDYLKLYDPAVLAMIEAGNDEEYIKLAYAYDAFRKKMEKFAERFNKAILAFQIDSVI